jgi:hypothetical protein
MAVIRVNFNTFEEGEQYLNRLSDEANRNFKIFLTLLSSYWQSTIDGPNYTREIKAMAIELARIRLALDDIRTDTYYNRVRADFLYQVLTSVLFPQREGPPDTGLSDLDFRDFLLEIVKIYFQGSIPKSMKDAVELFVTGQVRIIEAFEEARIPGSGFDISDQFTFCIDVIVDSPGSTDVFLADKNIRILLNIIRPAHTLYKLRFILEDEYLGQKDPDPDVNKPDKITDTFSFVLSCYGYEDFRRFVEGVEGIDLLGTKKAVPITGEDHSADF